MKYHDSRLLAQSAYITSIILYAYIMDERDFIVGGIDFWSRVLHKYIMNLIKSFYNDKKTGLNTSIKIQYKYKSYSLQVCVSM